MRRLFLFGDVGGNFAETSVRFVAAAGGEDARIVLLTLGGPRTQQHLPRYLNAWARSGAANVFPVLPGEDGEVPPDIMDRLAGCTGIFMAGGETCRYHRLYVESAVGALIRERYLAGVPYGGVSAGALLANDRAIVAGYHLTTPGNRCQLAPATDREPVELCLAGGLGLLHGCVVDAHCAEKGTFPRLAAAVERAGAPWGLGIDETVCVEVTDERNLSVHGQGRAYLLQRLGVRRFTLRILEPGETFSLAEPDSQRGNAK